MSKRSGRHCSQSDDGSYEPRSQFYRIWLEGAEWELAEAHALLQRAKTDAERKRFAAMVTMAERQIVNVTSMARVLDEQEERRR